MKKTISLLILFMIIPGDWTYCQEIKKNDMAALENYKKVKFYQGNGVLYDQGRDAAMDRYILDLSSIELVENKKYEYTLSDLPHENFTIGLHIRADTFYEELSEHNPINAEIKITLVDNNKRVVVQEHAHLSEWIWTSWVSEGGLQERFVWRRGQEQEIHLKNGYSTYKRLGVLTDKGWGTSFVPQKGKEYHLKIEVIHATAREFPYTVRLYAKGGGWK